MKRFSAILMALMLVCSLACPVMAASIKDYPSIENIWTDSKTYPYAAVYDNGSYNPRYLYLFATKPYASPRSGGYDLVISAASSGNSYVRYVLEDGRWVYDLAGTNGLRLDESFISASSFDLSYTSGATSTPLLSADPDFFPPAPLHRVILEVVGEQMTVALPELGAVVSILVLCGVGCLALLISLPTLRKVLFRFLG